MKKYLLMALTVASAAMSAYAALNGDGFYRVHNYDTDRYIYVYDNKGKLDYVSTTVDLYAIQLWMGIDRAVSDPASVLYIEKHSDKYDIRTQGTGICQMISSYVSLRSDSRVPGTYWAYGSKSGMTKYLCDGSGNLLKEQSWMVGEGTNRRNWYITPIAADSENYFGVQPTVSVGGVNYASLYADFSFDFHSSGMAAYYVKSVDAERGVAVYEELPMGVPAATPVIVKCASASPAGNRLALGVSAPKVTDNKLTGVYFNYEGVVGHVNQVRYNKSTMRVLGVTKDGDLGLVTSDITTVPRNSFYLTVAAGTPADLKLVTTAEYEKLVEQDGIIDIEADLSGAYDVYNVQGVVVKHNATDLDGLLPGIYIINGHKHYVR